ncbi:MAG: rhodanese-like domain-containing protein [Chloroflexi bacterium]|nr:rhodanese-like domain-containing protein [Chloroflexota bacterium]
MSAVCWVAPRLGWPPNYPSPMYLPLSNPARCLPLVAEYLANLPAGYYTVKAEDLSAELAESPVVLIDLRTDGEYAEGFIEGSLHIPFADFMTRISEVPTTGLVVLYDNPTHRSTMAMVMLQLLGYTDIRVLAGGSGAWASAGLPLVTE